MNIIVIMFGLILSIFVFLLIYFLFWPVPLTPVAFKHPKAPPLNDCYEPNNILSQSERFLKCPEFGPEDVTFDTNGRFYTGLEDGSIVCFNPDGTFFKILANTNGRPLGMTFDSKENLIVADAKKGLLSISMKGDITLLTDHAKGDKILFADDLDIANDGTIYFSDASIHTIDSQRMDEIMDGRPHGRLLSYNPATQKTDILLDGLYFANGVTIGPDEEYILVTETMGYRVTRYWLKGSKKGQTDLFIENLPGFPDNIWFNGKDTFWLALPSPRIPIADKLQESPFLRKIFMRIPAFLLPKSDPPLYGFILGLDTDGNVIYNLQDQSGKKAFKITSVKEHGDMLYFGTIGDDAVKSIPLDLFIKKQ